MWYVWLKILPSKKAYLEMDMVGFSSYIHLLYVIEEVENSVIKIIGIKIAEFRLVERYFVA